ncbi:MAG: hypothetical protein PUK76_07605 [Treponema sp.]|nr:hypothetical protein [Treponema sp.]
MKYLNWMYANIPYKYLQPGEQSVLTALAIRYNDSPEKKDDTPSGYPSMAMLKRMTQLSESGISKIKVSLRRLGFVKWKSEGTRRRETHIKRVRASLSKCQGNNASDFLPGLD